MFVSSKDRKFDGGPRFSFQSFQQYQVVGAMYENVGGLYIVVERLVTTPNVLLGL